MASEMSSIQLGMGRISTMRMQTMPRASAMSPRLSAWPRRAKASPPEELPGALAKAPPEVLAKAPPEAPPASCVLVSVMT
jgi:hypothetical protein